MQDEKLNITLRKYYDRGYRNPVFFCRYFLNHWFPTPMPWFHKAILAILTRKCGFLEQVCTEYELDKILRHFVWKEDMDDRNSPEHPIFSYNEEGVLCMNISRFTLLMIPRGYSKTTLLNAFTIMCVVYELKKYPTYVSESGPHSETQLGNVKRELEENEKIITVFGCLKPLRNDTTHKWSAHFIITTNNIALQSKGRGSQIRGMNVNAQRPDMINIDDVEDKESVATAEQRKKVRTWFYNDLLPALPSPKRDPSAMVVVLGTLLHGEALLTFLARDPRFNTVILSCVDKDGEALWPEHMDLDDIENLRLASSKAGELSGFYMEYFSLLRNEETAKFKDEYIIIENPVAVQIPVVGKPLKTILELVPFRAIAIDPAISEKKSADYFAIAVVGMTEQGVHYVLDMFMEKGVHPDRQVHEFFRLCKLWKPLAHGVESIAYQAALIYTIKSQMFKYNYFGEITPITHSIKKTERVEGIIQPIYAGGWMRHVKHFPLLESQLLDWPNGKMDGPDVVSMAVGLLNPYAAANADSTIDLAADEFEPLEDTIEGDWRGAP